MPLNGSKLHPLSDHARSVLDRISRTPTPTQEINPGVVRRLMDEALAELVELPSPYASHKGRRIAHLTATQAGRDFLVRQG